MTPTEPLELRGRWFQISRSLTFPFWNRLCKNGFLFRGALPTVYLWGVFEYAFADVDGHLQGDSCALQADCDRRLSKLLVVSVEALVSGNEWKLALEFPARFRRRSFNNTLLIWAQHAAANERRLVLDALPSNVAGFKQRHALGRRVGVGQKGYMIFAPVTARFATATPAYPGS